LIPELLHSKAANLLQAQTPIKATSQDKAAIPCGLIVFAVKGDRC